MQSEDATLPRDHGPVPVLALTKSTGGIALYHKALVAGLSAQEFSIHTLCLSDNAEAYASDLRGLGQGAEAVAMARYRLDPLGDLAVYRFGLGVARRMGARIILCHGSKPGFIGRAIGWRLGIPAVYCQASTPFLPRVQGLRAPFYLMLEYLARGFGGRIVALTETARRISLAHRLASPQSISVIRTGIDAKSFSPQGRKAAIRARLGLPDAATVILWMGRFERQKAPDLFLEALARVMPGRGELHVLMVGEGSQAADLNARCKALPDAARLHILPWQAEPDQMMEASDILCLSSRWEGLPLVLIEAMAMGLAPVSTAVDGCAEVIEAGRNGWLVPPEDAGALAEALAQAADDGAARACVAAAARARVTRDFSQDRMLGDWRALLLELDGRRVS